MSGVRIIIGGSFFRRIREESCYYADKTGFLEELLGTVPHKVSVITRPRRFGKTLMMTTLEDFFDITQDSKAIFDGLAISKNKALCDKWMNQYPVVFVTFQGIEGQSFEEALEKMRSRMSNVCNTFPFLTESKAVRETDRQDL